MNTPTDTPSRRAQELLARLERLGITDMSEREAKQVLGVSRETWSRLRNGERVYPNSLEKMERGIDEYVQEHGLEEIDQGPTSDESQEPETFHLTISIGALDLKVTASGRPQDADLVRAQVERAVVNLMREAKG